MTPPAAGATSSLDRQAPSSPRRVSARNARRISGPARPNARTAPGVSRSVAAVALPAPGITLPGRRPVRTGAPSRRPAKGDATQNPGIALRTAGALQRLPASALLDRLMRGRLWIGLLAFALIGIVAMQLVVLKLNTGIGGRLQHEASLQRENAELGIENSVYSAENRIAPLAAATGMTFAPPGVVHFVAASPDDVSRAANALSSAAQTSTSAQSQSTEAALGEAGVSSQSTAATGEAETSAASSGTAESSEASPASSSESSAPAAAAASSATATAPATTPASSAGEQAGDATAGSAGGASAPAGPQG
jgi:hypothetical protein